MANKVYIERYLPVVRLARGLFTKLPINTTSTLTVGGLATFNGGRVGSIVSGQGATDTLTAAQSGGTILFDRAAGIIYTLPAPVVGLTFTFIVTTSVTSNNDKVITDAGTTLLTGSVVEATTGGAANLYVGNGSSHIAVLMNGTTTGGLQGTKLEFTCVTSTLWEVSGWNNASGTIATPFSTT